MAHWIRSMGLATAVLGSLLAPTALLAAEKATEELISEKVQKQIEQARPLEIERLVNPIKSIQGPVVSYVANPQTGSYNVLLHYYETYTRNNHLYVANLATGEVKRFDTPAGRVINFFASHQHGKIYFHGPGSIMVYNTSTNDITPLGEEIGGETRPFTFGPDGMIYVAGSSQSRPTALQINPDTDKVTQYGFVGPSNAPNACWGYSVAADDTHVYVASGKVPWRLVAYNRSTKESKVLLTLEDPRGLIGFGQHQGKLQARVRTDEGNSYTRYWLGNGEVTVVKTNQEEPPAHTANTVVRNNPTAKFTGELKPDGDGNVEVVCTFSDGKSGTVKINVPTYPANVYNIIAGPDGKIYGSGGNYLGLFAYDPATNTNKQLVYSPTSMPLLRFVGDKLVYTGYPSGVTMVYDPSKPWNHASSNPKRMVYLGNEGAGIHTPFAAQVGADGKFYAAGGWYRNGNGGGLGWLDVATGKAGGTHEGMTNYRITNMVAVGNARYMVMSTLTVRDHEGKHPIPEQAKIFVYDIQEGKLSSFETIAGLKHTGAIAGAAGDSTTVVALTRHPSFTGEYADHKESLLYAFDALTGKVLWQKKLPYPAGYNAAENYDASVGFNLTLGPDGYVWTFLGGALKQVDPARDWGLSLEDARLVRINPANGDIQVVGVVGMVGKMAFLGKDLYLGGGSKYHLEGSGAEFLRRVKNVLK